MEISIKDLSKLWGVDRSTALRRVKKGDYITEKRIVEVTQKQEVLFVIIDD